MSRLAVPKLKIAQIVPVTQAEGPGRRFAIWLQGCPLRCAGCCNPQMLPFDGGTETRADGLLAEIVQAEDRHHVTGITLLGGEPMAQAGGAAWLARRVQAAKLSVMVFSGLTLAQLRSMDDPAIGSLLMHTDILVDGPYIQGLRETRRRWVGSTNQRVHLLTDRYGADDPCWTSRNTVELRLADSQILVNGFPARDVLDD